MLAIACDEAGERSFEAMKFTGDAILTKVDEICSLLKKYQK